MCVVKAEALKEEQKRAGGRGERGGGDAAMSQPCRTGHPPHHRQPDRCALLTAIARFWAGDSMAKGPAAGWALAMATPDGRRALVRRKWAARVGCAAAAR